MVIKRFNESVKYYVFQVSPYDRTYMGSIWDTPKKPWIPTGSKMVAEFELNNEQDYIVVNQEQLDEINKIKEEQELKNKASKYNL